MTDADARAISPQSGHAAVAAILFDLDGTLLDTAPDLVATLNRLRARESLPPLALDSLRAHASHGSARLIQVGFAERSLAEQQALQKEFLRDYREHLSEGTTLFDGMSSLIDEIRSLGLRTGIVTNKPGWLTTPLLRGLQLDTTFDCVVSGDTVEFCKPHPKPMLHAAELLKLRPAQCVYLGDAERDVQAAQAAGMPALVALYGYLDPAEDIRSWKADGNVLVPQDVIPWLRAHGYL